MLSERCIDDEIPFEIPESWEWTRLASLIELISGVDLSPRQYNAIHDGIPYLTGASNFDNGTLIENRWTCVPRRIAMRGDLLFTCKGTVGEMAINKFEEAHIARQIMAIRPIDVCALDFIELFLASMVEKIKTAARGVIPGIERSTLLDACVSIPPLAEQERIVKRIKELVPYVNEYGALESAREALDSALPECLRKSVLQMAVEGKLVPQNPDDEPAFALLDRIREERARLIKEKKIKAPKGGESVIYRASDGGYYEKRGNGEPVCIDDEIPFEIPESWEWVRLGSLCSLLIGKTPARSEIKYWSNGSFPWVSISDMKQGEVLNKTKELVSAEAMASCFKAGLVPAGTLIMSFKLTIGRTCILGMDAVHNEAIISVQTTCDPGFTQRDYLAYQLPYLCTFGDSKDAIKGSTLNKDSLSNLLIPIPPLAEQQCIVERVDELMPPIDEQRRIADVVSNALRQFTNRQ